MGWLKSKLRLGLRQHRAHPAPRVTPFEVEEAAVRPHVTIPAKTIEGEERWKLFGKTASKRYLAVVFTIRRKLFRTVTAYEMNGTERRKYAPQVD